MTAPHEPDPLRPSLERVEQDLKQRLEEACAMDDPRAETTGELIKLEEVLSDAARAAKQAVSLRRRLRQGGAAGVVGRRSSASETGAEPAGGSGDRPGAVRGGSEVEGIREIVAADGEVWRVWEVRPDRRGAARVRGDYESGWLTFETTDGRQLKRLPNFPADWGSLDDAALAELLVQATSAAARRGRPRGSPPEPPH